jgi:hypothetical protein
MDPFARKMLFGSFVFGGVMLVMFAVLTLVYLHTRPRCSDHLVAEANSQETYWTAAIMERRCGEDAPFFTHVNIRPAGEPIKRGFFSGSATEGEIFVIEQDAAGAGITIGWTNPDTLLIHCPHCNTPLIRKRDERWKGLLIKYDRPLASQNSQQQNQLSTKY